MNEQNAQSVNLEGIRKYLEAEETAFNEDTRIMDSYRKRGFIKDDIDEQHLHQSFSPYRVPRGLTKLQIRRRINKYVRDSKKPSDPVKDFLATLGNRLEVRINGKLVLGASFTSKVPENERQLKRLLTNLFNYKKVRVRRKL